MFKRNIIDKKKVIIVGSGPAACTAAIYLSRAFLKPLVYEGLPQKDSMPGGQLMLTGLVENYPGFPNGILGPELMDNMKKQAINFGTEMVSKSIIDIDTNVYPFKLTSNDEKVSYAFSIIIATGANSRWLNLKNELRLRKLGAAISTCAICDGSLPIFKNQNLAVVGGGDTALEEALYLARIAKKVFLIHRRDKFRASKILQNLVINNPKINILWDSHIKDILGENSVEAILIKNNKEKKEMTLSIKGLFVAIGHIPNTGFLKSNLELDSKGYILLNKTSNFPSSTSKPGIFACGDVCDPYYRQAITSSAAGCIAAIDTEKWLSEKGLM